MARIENEIPLTEEMLAELEQLKKSEAVRLARKEQRLLYRKRQELYQLRNMEKRGKALMKSGVTMENMAEKLFGGSVEGMADDDE